MYRFDGLEKRFRRLLLHHNSAGSGRNCGQVRLSIRKRGQDQHAAGLKLFDKISYKIETILSSQIEVEKTDIRPIPAALHQSQARG